MSKSKIRVGSFFPRCKHCGKEYDLNKSIQNAKSKGVRDISCPICKKATGRIN